MRFVDQWQRPLYMASVSGKSIFIWLGVWFSHTPRIHHESRPFEFQVLSPNIEMANCGILFGLRHQNEAWHTKGSRGHSPTFHLFNFLSLACNLYLSRSWNICPKSPSVHPASQERHLAINMTERTFRRSRGRFMFLFAPVPQPYSPPQILLLSTVYFRHSYTFLRNGESPKRKHYPNWILQTIHDIYIHRLHTFYTQPSHSAMFPQQKALIHWWFRKFPPTWDAFRSSHRFPQGSQWWELDRAPWLSGIDGYHATGTKLPRGNFKDDGSFLDFWISLRFLFR